MGLEKTYFLEKMFPIGALGMLSIPESCDILSSSFAIENGSLIWI